MKISIQQLRDYAFCPMYYKYEYIEKRKESKRLQILYYEKMHKIIYLFYHHLLDEGKSPSLKLLLSKWQSIWDNRSTKEDILYSTKPLKTDGEKAIIRNSYIRGIKFIDRLYDSLTYEPGTPILVDKEYEVTMGGHTLSGTIELVREFANQIEIVDFKFDRYSYNAGKDWDIIAASYAFRKMFKRKEDRILYWNFGNHDQKAVHINESHYKELLDFIDIIEVALKHNIFYPVYNTRCNECSYYRTCQLTKGGD